MSTHLKTVAGGEPVRQQAAAWFARLHADDVTDAQTRQWQAWLDADSRHRSAYERIERMWSALGAHAPEPEIARRMLATDVACTPSRRSRTWLSWTAAAAAVSALAIGAWGLLQPAGAPQVEYVTAVGEHRSVTLEDGTRITLDTDSRLQVSYTDRDRSMTLEHGRAYFAVARDARPLSVRTAHGSVRALGTEFEVYRHPHALEVTLIEGEVLLLPATDGDAQDPIAMHAGQRARLGAGADGPRLEPIDAAPPPWLSGRLVFVDASLDEVVSEFGRYSHQRIVLDGDGLAGIRISGVFRSDGLQAFVGALSDAYPVAVDTSVPGVLRLYRATPPVAHRHG